MANSRQRASGYVANRVAACFATGDAHGRKTAHQGRRVIDVDIMELKILPRGDMGDPVGVFLRQFSDRLELLRGNAAEGDFDPHHARRIPQRVRSFDQVARHF
jgi:hypothetical protein